MDFYPASSLVIRPTRPTEPLGRPVGPTSDSLSALSGSRSRSAEKCQAAIADIVNLNYGEELRSRNELMHVF